MRDKAATEVLSSTDTRMGVAAEASLAVDGVLSTCARSGFSRGSWFKAKLPAPRSIKHIDLLGNEITNG